MQQYRGYLWLYGYGIMRQATKKPVKISYDAMN